MIYWLLMVLSNIPLYEKFNLSSRKSTEWYNSNKNRGGNFKHGDLVADLDIVKDFQYVVYAWHPTKDFVTMHETTTRFSAEIDFLNGDIEITNVRPNQIVNCNSEIFHF